MGTAPRERPPDLYWAQPPPLAGFMGWWWLWSMGNHTGLGSPVTDERCVLKHV